MPHRPSLFSIIILGASALFVGFFAGGMLTKHDVAAKDILLADNPVSRNFVSLGKLTYRDSLPPAEGRAAVVNSDRKEVTLYRDGEIVDTLVLQGTGAEGTPWETPAGRYKVLLKKSAHTSPLTSYIYPHAIQFFGNSFFHGAPYKKTSGDTAAVPGSIQLGDADAKELYTFLREDDIVIVRSREAKSFVSIERLASIGALTPRYNEVLEKPLKLSGLSYYVADLDTGEVILSRAEDVRRPIASITKLFTAVTATDYYPERSVIEVSPRAISTLGTQGNLTIGERMGIKDMLYPLLLESSNDAAEAIAESLGREQFIRYMNDLVRKVGLSKTSFTDPSGLSSRNVSTAKDLFTYVRYLYRFRPDILEISRTKSHAVVNAAGVTMHSWPNHNKFVRAGDTRYIGGKTGYIDESGLTSAFLFSLPLAEFSNKNIAIIILNSANRDRDNKAILNAIYDSLQYEGGPSVRTVRNIPIEKPFLEEDTKDRVSLMFVGNIALPQNALNTPTAYFAESGFLKESDITIAPLLGPASDLGYDLGGKPSFRADKSFLTVLRGAGITALALANEHAGDWGRNALEDTVRNAEAVGITPIGAGTDLRAARQLKVINKNGMRIGFLGVAGDAPSWLSEPSNVPVVVTDDNTDFSELIRSARLQVDTLIVSYASPQGLSPAVARAAIQAGAKIVIGTGPHRIGELEEYEGGLIAYSLGDFLYDPKLRTSQQEGIALEVLIQGGEIIEKNGAKVSADERGIPYLLEDDL